MGDQNSRPAWVKDLSLFGVIVTDVLGYSGAGLALGYFAWKKLGFPGWTAGITAMIGLGLAFWKIYRLSQLGNKNGSNSNTDDGK